MYAIKYIDYEDDISLEDRLLRLDREFKKLLLNEYITSIVITNVSDSSVIVDLIQLNRLRIDSWRSGYSGNDFVNNKFAFSLK